MHVCRHRLGPTSANRVPAHCHPLPGRPPCRALIPPRAAVRPTRPTIRALLGLGFVPPPEPRPCAHCVSIAYALLPAARVPLCRHRADPESSSRSLPSGSPVRIAPVAPTARRRPHRAHRALTSASPPPSLSSRCVGPGTLAGKNRTVCIPFSPNARKRPPSWQHPPEMHAFRDQDGNILAPCIHSRAQSGDLGYMARESCRQGPTFASRSPKSRMARRCCQRRPAFPRQRPAVRPNGLCAMRQRHATRGMAERALRPAARAWPACRMPPCHLARVHRRCLTRVALRRPHRAHRVPPFAAPPIAVGASRRSGSSCRPRAAHADASRPSMRVRRHRLGPNPRQPGPSPAPTESRPPVEPSAPTRAPPPVASRPAAWVPLRFW